MRISRINVIDNSKTSSYKRTLNSTPAFCANMLRGASAEYIKKTMVEKYLHSGKYGAELRQQIIGEILVEKFGWATPTKVSEKVDIKDTVILNVVTMGMAAVMEAIKKQAEKEEAAEWADAAMNEIESLRANFSRQ